MKANHARIFFTLMSSLSLLSVPALAKNNANNSDYVIGDAQGPEGPISAEGLENGLELYHFDKADSCVPGALQIRVNITNVFKQGIVKLELFGERDFMKTKGKLRRIRVAAQDGPQLVCINLPYPGQYAVVSYHDMDGNRKLKKAWNFRPKEPYGLSNNPKIEKLRLPKWSETNFAVPLQGADITINLVDAKDKA